MKAERPLNVVFFKSEAGNEPVREWLKGLPKEDCKTDWGGLGNNMKNRAHRGSNLRTFLETEGVLGEVEIRALKQALAIQLEHLLKEKAVTKAEMASRMRTSRAAVDRLLDASNPSVTLTTLGKAARALGQKLKIELLPG